MNTFWCGFVLLEDKYIFVIVRVINLKPLHNKLINLPITYIIWIGTECDKVLYVLLFAIQLHITV